jgi:hypothetical protein
MSAVASLLPLLLLQTLRVLQMFAQNRQRAFCQLPDLGVVGLRRPLELRDVVLMMLHHRLEVRAVEGRTAQAFELLLRVRDLLPHLIQFGATDASLAGSVRLIADASAWLLCGRRIATAKARLQLAVERLVIARQLLTKLLDLISLALVFREVAQLHFCLVRQRRLLHELSIDCLQSSQTHTAATIRIACRAGPLGRRRPRIVAKAICTTATVSRVRRSIDTATATNCKRDGGRHYDTSVTRHS